MTIAATSVYKPCACCGSTFLLPRIHWRGEDPWEGRMDDYCDRCALTRCDAYPGECPVPASGREQRP